MNMLVEYSLDNIIHHFFWKEVSGAVKSPPDSGLHLINITLSDNIRNNIVLPLHFLSVCICMSVTLIPLWFEILIIFFLIQRDLKSFLYLHVSQCSQYILRTIKNLFFLSFLLLPIKKSFLLVTLSWFWSFLLVVVFSLYILVDCLGQPRKFGPYLWAKIIFDGKLRIHIFCHISVFEGDGHLRFCWDFEIQSLTSIF